MKTSDRHSLATGVLAALAMLVRSLDTARRATPRALIEEAAHPASVLWGIDRGGPAEPGWLEAVRPLAGEPLWDPVLLLALAKSKERPPQVRAYLESRRAHGSPAEQALAAFALSESDAAR